MRVVVIALATVLALLLPAATHAQMQIYRGVEFWAGYAGWNGGDADNLSAGLRGGAAVFGWSGGHGGDHGPW